MNFLHELGRHQLLFQADEDACFELLALDGEPVLASAPVAVIGAAVPVVRDDRVPAAAGAALQEAGEEEAGAMRCIQAIAGCRALDQLLVGSLPRLHRRP